MNERAHSSIAGFGLEARTQGGVEMIEATSKSVRYQTQLTNGTHSALSDTTREKGGSESGFRPHELLEAALASCMNITIRMYADKHGIALSGVTTRVTLDRSNPEETMFEYEVELQGELSEQDRVRLLDVAGRCPVRRTLSTRLTFRTTTRMPKPREGRVL